MVSTNVMTTSASTLATYSYYQYWNESPPQVINIATLPCKMKQSLSRYTTTSKRDKIPEKSQKSVSALHIAELSTAVVKVDIKVINASLTQNQCLQCVTPALTCVEIPRPRDATELNNDGTIKLGDVHYQSDRIYQFENFYSPSFFIP